MSQDEVWMAEPKFREQGFEFNKLFPKTAECSILMRGFDKLLSWNFAALPWTWRAAGIPPSSGVLACV